MSAICLSGPCLRDDHMLSIGNFVTVVSCVEAWEGIQMKQLGGLACCLQDRNQKSLNNTKNDTDTLAMSIPDAQAATLAKRLQKVRMV